MCQSRFFFVLVRMMAQLKNWIFTISLEYIAICPKICSHHKWIRFLHHIFDYLLMKYKCLINWFKVKYFLIKNKLTALMSIIFVTIVQTIVIAIADINSRYAIAIVTCEQITEACSTLWFTIFWRFIRRITTI